MKTKNYYILYKVIKDTQENIKDIEYLTELTNYNDIVKYLKCRKNNISKMINKSFTKDLKYHNDIAIIKETI